MKQVDYIPILQDLFDGLIGQKVIVHTTNTPLGGILSDVSKYFIELRHNEFSTNDPRRTYVLSAQIVAITADVESELKRVE